MALYFECRINKNALSQIVFFLPILPTGVDSLYLGHLEQKARTLGHLCSLNFLYIEGDHGIKYRFEQKFSMRTTGIIWKPNYNF